jgi:drug/metabolite transporter (DMT)-like permease
MKTLSHRQAVVLMVLCTLMWSIAGVVTRQLESARSFEVTFWRSAFTAIALIPLLAWLRGPMPLWRTVRAGGRALWLSAACWCAMFTAFMVAVTLTTVANVLVTLALAPLMTALMARFVLKHRLPPRTWGAIVVAGIGIAWMYGADVVGGEARHLIGVVIALVVPLAAATNWTLLQHLARRGAAAVAQDMLPAVLLGAVLSSVLTLLPALPLAASQTDIAWLGLLAVVQLAIPCLLAVIVARTLSAPECSLIALLEVVFGVTWAWIGGGESPSAAVLGGGLLVVGALAANEALALRTR